MTWNQGYAVADKAGVEIASFPGPRAWERGQGGSDLISRLLRCGIIGSTCKGGSGLESRLADKLGVWKVDEQLVVGTACNQG